MVKVPAMSLRDKDLPLQSGFAEKKSARKVFRNKELFHFQQPRLRARRQKDLLCWRMAHMGFQHYFGAVFAAQQPLQGFPELL